MNMRAWFADVLRLARRETDFSQRELARWAGVAKSTIADAESGRCQIGLETAAVLLRCMNFELRVHDPEGKELGTLIVDYRRDCVERQFPAHLDLLPKTDRDVDQEYRRPIDPRPRSKPPPSRWTFRLSRLTRDIARAHGYYGEQGDVPRVPPIPDVAAVHAMRPLPWPEAPAMLRWERRSPHLRTTDWPHLVPP